MIMKKKVFIGILGFVSANYWREKPQMNELKKNNFSFEINNILYFMYFNQTEVVPVFYDISSSQTLWSSKYREKNMTVELPFFNGIILGVYKDEFISIIEPSSILAYTKAILMILP